MRKLVILESHPVQYRVPVYRELARLCPDSFEVFFASDCSVRGYMDAEFGARVKWRQPMLEGFPWRVLGNERGEPLRGFRSLHGRGVISALRQINPRAVLFTGYAYEFDWAALAGCLAWRIPVWMRQETQDYAHRRSGIKTHLRYWVYTMLYRAVVHAFYIGELNRRHLLRHGIPEGRMSRCPYCVVNPYTSMEREEKQRQRDELRKSLQVGEGDFLVAFVGKLIPKKDPGLLCQAFHLARQKSGRPWHLIFIGCGELEPELRATCSKLGIAPIYAGFINQDRLPQYYLAADAVALPSQEGETWGLVINEALQAGCAAAFSRKVGCSAEFGQWERCRVFPESNAEACAESLKSLSNYHRSFDWAAGGMEQYSIEAAAMAFANKLALPG